MTDEYLTEAAGLLGITIDPAWLPEIRFNLELMLRLSESVLSFELPDEAEPAPVFSA